MLSLPIAVYVALLATPLVGLLSGRSFLPQSADILVVLVWSIVFGWINSLTNYVLIAVDRQRFVLIASGARVLFAIAANALLVGRYSYAASAWILIGGEFLLLVLFASDLRRILGPVDLVRHLSRPVLAGLGMAAATGVAARYGLVVAGAAGSVVYVLALILVRALNPGERALLAQLLPARVRELVPRQWAGPPA
jgi:O-antigen/teichoic acid export membrane protein